MNKNNKITLSKGLLILLVIVLMFTIFLSSNKQYLASEGPIDTSLVIKDYSIEMNVKQNSTISIVERIKVDFITPHYGIDRSIPYKATNTYKGQSNEVSLKISKVKNGTSSLSMSYYPDYLVVHLGSDSYRTSGIQNYYLSYTVSFGKENFEGFDLLDYLLLGNDWDMVIENFSFDVTFPVDISSLPLKVGHGNLDNSNTISFTRSENKLQGASTKAIQPYNNVYFVLEFEDGFFNQKLDTNIFFLIGFGIAFIVLSLLLWFLFGRDPLSKKQKTKTPPGGLTPLQLKYVYTNGVLNDKDTVSVFASLVNSKVIRMDNVEGFGSASCSLINENVKLNTEEEIVADALFESNSGSYSFYGYDPRIEEMGNKIQKEVASSCDKYVSNSSRRLQKTYKILGTIALVIYSGLISVIVSGGFASDMISIASLVMGTVPVIFVLVMALNGMRSHIDFLKTLPIFLFLFIFTQFVAVLTTFTDIDIVNLIPRFILLGCWITLMLIHPILIKRTQEGASIYGQTLGFIEYLKEIGSSTNQYSLTEYHSYLIPYLIIFNLNCNYVRIDPRTSNSALQYNTPGEGLILPVYSPRFYYKFYSRNYSHVVRRPNTNNGSHSSFHSGGGGGHSGGSGGSHSGGSGGGGGHGR